MSVVEADEVVTLPVMTPLEAMNAPVELKTSPPTYRSHRMYEATNGHRFAQFAELFLTATRGFSQGDALELMEWQKTVLEDMFELTPEGYWRYRQFILGVPRKNGKSMMAAIIVLFCLLFEGEGTQIYSAAKDREQAKIVYTEVAAQIRRNPWLKKQLKVTRDRITNPANGAVYKVLTADAGAAQGLGPTIVVGDELGEWKGTNAEALYSALTEGSGDRPQSMFIGISTAGYNPESLLGRLYKHGRRVSLPKDHDQYLEDPYFGFAWWEAPQGCDVFDPQNWALANPNLGEGLLARDDFARALTNPTPFNLVKFQRYRLNQWVRIDGVEFISRAHWEKAKRVEKIPLGAQITLGFDGSNTGDSTGFVACDIATGQMEVLGSWENLNQQTGWYVDKDEVFKRLKEIAELYDVKLIWADPSYFETDIIKWGRELGLRVDKVPANRMFKWAQRFTSALVYGEAFQPDDERLTRHTFNAVLRDDGSFEKVSKKSKEKIDLLVCATLAVGAREFLQGRGETKVTPGQVYLSDSDLPF